MTTHLSCLALRARPRCCRGLRSELALLEKYRAPVLEGSGGPVCAHLVHGWRRRIPTRPTAHENAETRPPTAEREAVSLAVRTPGGRPACTARAHWRGGNQPAHLGHRRPDGPRYGSL